MRRPLSVRARRDEDGAALVEFALVFPTLVLLLFALVDFGLIFGGYITMRNGVAAGARAASVNDYTVAGTTCTGGPNANTADMVCSIFSDLKQFEGTSISNLAIGICFFTPGSSNLGCGTESSSGQSTTQDVEVCAQASIKSTTGITTPFLNGKTISASSRLLLEQPQPAGSTSYEAFNAASTAVSYNGTTVWGMNCT